ncbi:MAG: hypothetical protein U9N84_07430 [Actinomycetota bacterium]|nr:hypothetical protein [Actinomycetota bacterium]
MQRPKAETELRNYAESLLTEAGSGPPLVPQLAVVSGRLRRWRSPYVAIASMGLMVFGNIGMAAATDSAVPGDLLYPIDRAYESVAGLVGVDVGGPTERMEEASVLLARGDFELAVQTIAGTVSSIDQDLAASVKALSPVLDQLDSREVKREDLHNAVATLVDTARGIAEDATGRDRAMLRRAVRDQTRIVAEVARGGPFAPPGQDDDFTPPGKDKDNPPGQDDKTTPPGQDKENPPGQDKDKDTPPGQDKDKDTPPGQDKDKGIGN